MKNLICVCTYIFITVLFTSCDKQSFGVHNQVHYDNDINVGTVKVITFVDDSIKTYLRPLYFELIDTEVSEDSLNYYENLLGVNSSFPDSIYYKFAKNNVSNLQDLEEASIKLHLYFLNKYSGLTDSEKVDLMSLAWESYFNEDLEERADPCLDYKNCIKNAQVQVGLNAISDIVSYGITGSVVGPWGVLGGMILATGKNMYQGYVAKKACCTSQAIQNNCCI